MPKFGFCRTPLYQRGEAFAYAMGPLRLSVTFTLPCPQRLIALIVRFQDWRERRADGE